jgi:hypothetical protein
MRDYAYLQRGTAMPEITASPTKLVDQAPKTIHEYLVGVIHAIDT